MDRNVAPLAGAWIEICISVDMLMLLASLPSRERGLKSCANDAIRSAAESLPSRERGLKLAGKGVKSEDLGRSPRGSVD